MSIISLQSHGLHLFLVWCGSFLHCNFHNSPRIWQQTHMCTKIVQSLDKKVGGGVMRIKRGESAGESNQSWISSVIISPWYIAIYIPWLITNTLTCEPLHLLLPHPGAEWVQHISISVCFPAYFLGAFVGPWGEWVVHTEQIRQTDVCWISHPNINQYQATKIKSKNNSHNARGWAWYVQKSVCFKKLDPILDFLIFDATVVF